VLKHELTNDPWLGRIAVVISFLQLYDSFSLLMLQLQMMQIKQGPSIHSLGGGAKFIAAQPQRRRRKKCVTFGKKLRIFQGLRKASTRSISGRKGNY